ncbi:ATP-binding protein [Paracoccus sp. (in: a-proteobacteria)]|uniref:ATP-binding protein n=1 Tax=Paracoccus sp. TaxID=267 RepID=UPI003A839A59
MTARPQILERDDQLQMLAAAVAGISRGGGRIALVHGEAGVGKSTLVESVLAALPRQTGVAVGYCDPLNTPRPLGPVRDILRALALDRSGEDSAFDRFLTLVAARDHPCVAVIEDLHWSDQRSLDWFKFVGRRITQLPLLLIATFRDEALGTGTGLRGALGALPPASTIRIPLAPLGRESVRKLCGGDPDRAEAVFRVSGGNPFFVSELVAADDGQIPESVLDVILARLQSLDEGTRRFIDLAACNAGELPLSLVTGGALGESAGNIDRSVQQGVLVPTQSGLAFRHELARLAILDHVPPARRLACHQLWLDAYLGADDPARHLDRIVHHAEGAARPDIILRFAPLAARDAAALGAHREAALYLRSACDCLGNATDAGAAEVLEAFAYEAALALGIDDAVIAARRRAARIRRALNAPQMVADNLRWLSRLHWYRGEADLAGRYIHEAIALLENEAPLAAGSRAQALALRAQFAMLRDRMADAVDWGLRALDLARQAAEPEIEAHALNTIGSARLFRGDADGETLLCESLRVSLAGGFHEQAARAYTNLSECLVEAGDFERAEALIDEGIAFDVAHDLDAWTFYLIGRKAQLALELDRYDQAVAICNHCLAQENQTLLMQMPARIVLARARLRMGAEDAPALLDEALEAAGQIAEPQYLTPLHAALLEAAVLAADPARAQAALDWIAAQPEGTFSPRKTGEILFWRLLLGHSPAPPSGLPPAFALMAGGDFAGAAQAFREGRSFYLSAWALVAGGTAEGLADALAIFGDLGAVAARAALAPRLKGARRVVRRGPYAVARKNPYGLTAKEQLVLRHLIVGKTNAAIAEDICRSRRTIENHVSAILSKLGCAGRLEVVLKLQAEPWISGSES